MVPATHTPKAPVPLWTSQSSPPAQRHRVAHSGQTLFVQFLKSKPFAGSAHQEPLCSRALDLPPRPLHTPAARELCAGSGPVGSWAGSRPQLLRLHSSVGGPRSPAASRRRRVPSPPPRLQPASSPRSSARESERNRCRATCALRRANRGSSAQRSKKPCGLKWMVPLKRRTAGPANGPPLSRTKEPLTLRGPPPALRRRDDPPQGTLGFRVIQKLQIPK